MIGLVLIVLAVIGVVTVLRWAVRVPRRWLERQRTEPAIGEVRLLNVGDELHTATATYRITDVATGIVVNAYAAALHHGQGPEMAHWDWRFQPVGPEEMDDVLRVVAITKRCAMTVETDGYVNIAS